MTSLPDITTKRRALTPDRIALIDEATGRRVTYAALDDRAARIAAALAALGAGRGDRIAILCHNCAAFFEILFAAAKAGLVLVPLNWRQPVPELVPVLEDCRPALLLHDAAHAAAAAEFAQCLGLRALSLEALDGAAEAATPVGAAPAWDRDGLWYLLYTSGTTGRPKAVMQTFGMALANYVNVTQALDLVGGDTTVNYLPLFHTAGINLYTLPILIAGGTARILPKFDDGRVLRLLAERACTVFLGVPAVYQALAAHPEFDGADLSGVRLWGSGGAALPAPLIRRYAARGIRLCNGMGMTETGPTIFLMDPARVEDKIGSVGKPQLLTEVRVVDERGHDVRPGDAGELLFRGPNITPGYWNNPAATAAAFTAEGWLRSGDVGRRDEDGYYFIVDRIKDMYISGGENVYPAEVESVLHRHPAVLDAAVIGIADEKWGETGCAFIVARAGAVPDPDDIRAFCRRNLAAYKVPKTVLVLDDFPRTAAGKVRKNLLRQHLPS